ncbi:WD40-repeat-containing domain protein [Gymnopilus junonius]|uniref:WD40-repeat-containing domain protein n=1 Tax=Gymnopilus junonius TaxID=109634 RepID=A0A9P5TS18_GYMJU|nr:WD40-repeat-containing domain protein [Gymnopilus junonius]
MELPLVRGRSTGIIQNAHGDLITDAAYDFYGFRLATCGLDQRIKIWQLDGSNENSQWTVEDDWKAHDAPISKLSWAHPEFGSILASSSFDRTVKIWEQAGSDASSQPPAGFNGSSQNHSGSGPVSSRWIERAVLADAKGTIRGVEFAPHHFGLKLATIATDNMLRIYECIEQPSLVSWQLTEELDVQILAPGPSPGYLSRVHTVALSTPTQTHATLEGASASLVSQALQQGLQQQNVSSTSGGRLGPGNKEADGGWCLSWCKDKYWGEIIAVGCGTTGTIKIVQINARKSTTLLTLSSTSSSGSPTSGGTATQPSAPTTAPTDASDSRSAAPAGPANYAITSVAWAPSCGRSYHLIATGGRDGHVRIWKIKPGSDEFDFDNMAEGESEDLKWTAVSVADFDQHKSAVGRVEWNITGSILSSSGNDGRIRLWKATSEQVEDSSQSESKDVDMDG